MCVGVTLVEKRRWSPKRLIKRTQKIDKIMLICLVPCPSVDKHQQGYLVQLYNRRCEAFARYWHRRRVIATNSLHAKALPQDTSVRLRDRPSNLKCNQAKSAKPLAQGVSNAGHQFPVPPHCSFWYWTPVQESSGHHSWCPGGDRGTLPTDWCTRTK